jgi:translation initiation factor 2 subunit 2
LIESVGAANRCRCLHTNERPSCCAPSSSCRRPLPRFYAFPVPQSLGKKKKKKKAKARGEDEFGGEEGGEGGGAGGAASAASRAAGGLPWEGSDRDYSYEELLDRVFGILKANNPELTGERRRTTLKPPQVAREGTKKTVFTNFMDLCRSMNRNPEHLQAYLLAELGTSGSQDGQQRLIMKGRFLPKAFEGCLRRYMNEYVLCNSCKSPDTLLDRDSSSRIMFLRCQQCGASRTVSAIKAGFQARTVSRKSQQTG